MDYEEIFSRDCDYNFHLEDTRLIGCLWKTPDTGCVEYAPVDCNDQVVVSYKEVCINIDQDKFELEWSFIIDADDLEDFEEENIDDFIDFEKNPKVTKI